MAFTHISHVPGHDLADYRAVSTALGAEPPEGRLMLIAGEADGALHIIEIWESKASADRFVAERLFPAFQSTGRGPGPEATYIEFDSEYVSLDRAAQ